MKQSQFVTTHEPLWQRLEAWLDVQAMSKGQRKALSKSPTVMGTGKPSDADNDAHLPTKDQTDLPVEDKLALAATVTDFPADYRRLCHHLALAQSRMYSPLLTDRLNQLVIRGHHQLYASRSQYWHRIVDFYLRDFPALIRQEGRSVMLASALFFGSLFVMLLAIQLEPELVYSVMPGEQVAMMEDMYDPALRTRIGRFREADSDVLMFGHYIRNNTSIGFQSFAGGLLFGLGTLFFLLYNGIVIGAAAGHLTHLGYIETFWGFVSGHSAFELTAIALSGAAGFKLAQAIIMPGRQSRWLALQENSKIAIRIIYGAATLFIMAAFVEAFWSSQTLVPVSIKYLVGVTLWVLVIYYFRRAGRNWSVL